MEAIGLLVTLEARPGKEADAEAWRAGFQAPRSRSPPAPPELARN